MLTNNGVVFFFGSSIKLELLLPAHALTPPFIIDGFG